MIGLVYTDEGEASSFMKVVTKKKAAIGVYLRIYLSIIIIRLYLWLRSVVGFCYQFMIGMSMISEAKNAYMHIIFSHILITIRSLYLY